jgi:thiamine transport system ATP-binding protein
VLRVEGLAAGYGTGPDVLAGVDLDVAAGEVVALLGPSGSGKSTLLRCVAGLQAPRRGRVVLGGADATDVPVERRGVGLVFQDHALLPHRDVAGNVGLGPRLHGLAPAEVAARVAAVLADVGLAHLADRPVDALSGGEQQRVALARALAVRPRLLLLDEPYGSLDRPLRERLLAELVPLVRASGAGAVLVTHDQDDALAVADRVAVLLGGRLRQLAAPEVCWTRPADADVARFLGVGALLPAEVRAGAATVGGDVRLPLPAAPDGPALVLLPAARVRLAGEADRAGDAVLPAVLVGSRFAGDHHVLTVAVADGVELRLRRPRPLDVAVGAPLGLRIDAADLVALPAPDAPMEGASARDAPAPTQ